MMYIEKILTLPQGYQRLPGMPDDPEGCVNYGLATAHAQCILQAYPITMEKAMSFGHRSKIVEEIEMSLKDGQTLLEVETDVNRNGAPFAYSIVKSETENAGAQYFLTFHGNCGNEVLCVKGFFTNQGDSRVGKEEEALTLCRDLIRFWME